MASKRVTYTVRNFKPGERTKAEKSGDSGTDTAKEEETREASSPSEAHDRGAALLAKLANFHDKTQIGANASQSGTADSAPGDQARTEALLERKPNRAVAASIVGTTVALSALAAYLHVADVYEPNLAQAGPATVQAATQSQRPVTKPTSVKSAKAKLALAKPGIATPGIVRAPPTTTSPETSAKTDDKAAPVKTALPIPPRPSMSVLQALGNLEYAAAPRQDARTVRVKRGDTFMALLLRSGVPAKEAHAAITTMGGVYDPRRLRPGKKMKVMFGVLGSEQGRFLGIRFDASFDRTVSVMRHKDGDFVASEIKKQLTTKMSRGEGVVESSLFQTGLRAGVPASAMLQLINLFSFDVDFQRDIQPGDSFKIMYKDYRDANGLVVRQGDIVYAEMTLRRRTLKIYRHTPASGRTDYFNERGESSRKALMRTPIDGARLTSRFGRRRHPILGYTRLHRGVDFAAPRGTPVYAAGDGTIIKAGWNGGFGRYVKIRHNANYRTAYAHLRRIANGIKSGVRVKQGQTIGYVGTSGRSTGPHLHYEVHHNGRQTNPLALKLPAGQKLKGKDLAKYQAARLAMEKQFKELGTGQSVASADKAEKSEPKSDLKQKAEDDK